jgi:muramoyltetrapeptide carboxypeptidase
MVKIPPYLQKGDTVAIVCPAGFMPLENAETCISTLIDWGYKVKIGKTLGNQYHYFSGTDEERLADLQNMLDDESVKAILCGRGGYGVSRIIDQVNFKKFRKNPKWIIGFSDITVLHCHLLNKVKTASLHAPMAAAFNHDGFENEYVKSLGDALSGKTAKYQSGSHPFNSEGKAKGLLVGGNLALLAHIIGTPSDIKTKGKILFIEDIGEYIYNVDRLLNQLKRAGKLDRLAGMIFGGFTEMKDTTIPFGKPIDEVLRDAVAEYDYPVCFHFPVSHDKENYALKVGLEYELKVGNNGVELREI